MTLEQIEELKEFGRRIARLSPEQIERRKWAPWIAELRRREDIRSWEDAQDRREDNDYW